MKKKFSFSLAYIVCAFFSASLCLLLGCGGGGGGSSSTSTTTTVPSSTTSVSSTTTTTIQPTAMIGNYRFVFSIVSTWTTRITLDRYYGSKTSQGTDFFAGYDADFPSVTAALGAWLPSLSQYQIVSTSKNSTFIDKYVFSINSDNTLSGCYRLSSDSGSTWSSCYNLIIPLSRRTPLSSWDMSMEPQNKPIDINEVYQRKFNEDQEAEAQRGEFEESHNDSNSVSMINELKAFIGNRLR